MNSLQYQNKALYLQSKYNGAPLCFIRLVDSIHLG